MHLIIYISLAWLLFTGLILIRNQFEFKKLNTLIPSLDDKPFVSICIPARNEESVIGRCIESLQRQSYDNFEILVLNDQSEDKTGEILSSIAANDSRLRVFQGKDKPEDWLGKPHACHQLGIEAQGELLIFIDADTWWSDDALGKIVWAFKSEKLNAITVWPHQHLKSTLEKVVLPLVYYALNSLLVASHVKQAPKWIPAFVRDKVAPSFGAANGQCIGFTREAYEVIGGHESVKGEVVEDVELAKNLIRAKQTIQMFNGVHEVHCRMYEDPREIWNGFRKNFLAGFGNNLFLFFASWIIHVMVYIAPFVLIAYSIIIDDLVLGLLSFISIALIILHRFLLALQYAWNPVYSFTHILGVIWFQFLALQCVIDLIFGSKVKWKNRSI